MKKLGWLTGSTLFFWLLLIYPGWRLLGDLALIHSVMAMALCLLPALAVLFWMVTADGAPESQVVMFLGGTGIRLFTALGGALVLANALPETFTNAFWGWLAVFYLFVLTLETTLVLKKNSPQAG